MIHPFLDFVRGLLIVPDVARDKFGTDVVADFIICFGDIKVGVSTV